MELCTRTQDGAVTLDLYGQFPRSIDDLVTLRDKMDRALAGHRGPIVIFLHNAHHINSVQFGLLMRVAIETRRTGSVAPRVAVVSPEVRVRNLFNTCFPFVRAYETEDEALDHMGNVPRIQGE